MRVAWVRVPNGTCSVSTRSEPKRRYERSTRSWGRYGVAALVALVALASAGWYRQARQQAEIARAGAQTPRPDRSSGIHPTHWALAQLVMAASREGSSRSQASSARETAEEPDSAAADESSPTEEAAQPETTEAGREEESAEESPDQPDSEEQAEIEGSLSSNDDSSSDSYWRWRSDYWYDRYAAYRRAYYDRYESPYWYRRRYGYSDDSHRALALGAALASNDWLPSPASSAVSSSGSSPASSGGSGCAPDAGRWLVRMRGEPLAAEPTRSAGLTCLSDATVGDPVWLLRRLTRLIAASAEPPARVALIEHGGNLGVFVAPAADGLSALSSGLRVLGLGEAERRGRALIATLAGQGSSGQAVIDRELSVKVVNMVELTGLLASARDSRTLLGALGRSEAETPTATQLSGAGSPWPSLPQGGMDIEQDGCAQKPSGDMRPVAVARCAGDGRLLGEQRAGTTTSVFSEVVRDETDNPSRA